MKKIRLFSLVGICFLALSACSKNKEEVNVKNTSEHSLNKYTKEQESTNQKQSTTNTENENTITYSQESMIEESAQYGNNKLLAAKVMIKSLNMPTENIENYIQGLSSLNITTYPNYQIWSTGVYLPEEVTIVSATPMAGGMVTYHNNEDGTVTVYPVPSHYQDQAWDDAVKGKEMAEEVISQAKVVDIKDVSDTTAQKIADFMTGDI